MAIPKFLEDLLIISKLGDNPGADNGLSSSGLREKFDEAGVKIQKYINDTLIPALSGLSNPEEGLNMKNDIAMGGHRVTGLGEPVEDGDAVPLGYANGHFAPAGYGLGETGWKSVGITDVAQLDDLKTNGGYYVHRTSESPLTLAGIEFNVLGMQVNMMSSSYGEQVVNHTYGIRLRRYFDMGSWQPLEYENPPMVPGVLYRTTKRCEGKPVYAIRVDCGALPNDTVTNTPLNMSVAEYGADAKLVGIDYTVKHPDTAKPHHIGNPSYIDGVPMNCRLYSNGALYYCRFQTHGDLSAYTAVATLELILGG